MGELPVGDYDNATRWLMERCLGWAKGACRGSRIPALRQEKGAKEVAGFLRITGNSSLRPYEARSSGGEPVPSIPCWAIIMRSLRGLKPQVAESLDYCGGESGGPLRDALGPPP